MKKDFSPRIWGGVAGEDEAADVEEVDEVVGEVVVGGDEVEERGWGYVRIWWPTGQLPTIQVFMLTPPVWTRVRSAAWGVR